MSSQSKERNKGIKFKERNKRRSKLFSLSGTFPKSSLWPAVLTAPPSFNRQSFPLLLLLPAVTVFDFQIFAISGLNLWILARLWSLSTGFSPDPGRRATIQPPSNSGKLQSSWPLVSTPLTSLLYSLHSSTEPSRVNLKTLRTLTILTEIPSLRITCYGEELYSGKATLKLSCYGKEPLTSWQCLDATQLLKKERVSTNKLLHLVEVEAKYLLSTTHNSSASMSSL